MYFKNLIFNSWYRFILLNLNFFIRQTTYATRFSVKSMMTIFTAFTNVFSFYTSETMQKTKFIVEFR